MFGRSRLKTQKATKKAATKTTATTTQAVLPIAQLQAPYLERRDIHSWSGLIFVHGVLFDLLHEQEQDQILQRYRSFLHSLRGPIQIVCMTMPLHVEQEIHRFQAVTPRFPGDVLSDLAHDIADLLHQTTRNMETMLNIVVVTATTLDQCRQETDAVLRALRDVHSDLNPYLPSAEEILNVFAFGFGFDNPPAAPGAYQPVWQI